jgi:TetR/AcrR family transcriptional regulator, cholesterol catabolism regulator
MPRPSRWNDIVEAAAKVFQEKGFAAASLEDIATEVGMWKGSLYHYIDSKEELLLAVVSEPAEHILNDLRQVSAMDLPPAEKLRLVAKAHGHVLETTFVYASVYLQEVAGRQRSDEWAARDREYVQLITRMIEEGVARGDFSPQVDPRIATFTLIGALNWVTRWYKPGGTLTAGQITEQICTQFLNGVISRSISTPSSHPAPAVHPTVAPARKRSRHSPGNQPSVRD